MKSRKKEPAEKTKIRKVSTRSNEALQDRQTAIQCPQLHPLIGAQIPKLDDKTTEHLTGGPDESESQELHPIFRMTEFVKSDQPEFVGFECETSRQKRPGESLIRQKPVKRRRKQTAATEESDSSSGSPFEESLDKKRSASKDE